MIEYFQSNQYFLNKFMTLLSEMTYDFTLTQRQHNDNQHHEYLK